MISRIIGDNRVKWSHFKDDKDVSQAQRDQDLGKIARESKVTAATAAPLAWKPKWQRERDEALEAEAKAVADAQATAEAEAAEGTASTNAESSAPRARLKPRMQITLLGPSESGKSCLLGHLFYITGGVDKSTVAGYEKDASKVGQAGSKMAWVAERHPLERERGISMCCSRLEIQTDRYLVMGVDTPGHRDFLRNMVAGATGADAVLLVVPADATFERDVITEEASAGGVRGSVYEQMWMAFVLGVKQVIVAVNKMDAPEVGYSQDRFEFIRREMTHLLVSVVGFRTEGVCFVPISATDGDNLIPVDPKDKGGLFRRKKSRYYGIVQPNENMLWWENGTLTEAIDNLVLPPRLSVGASAPLRIPVSEVFTKDGKTVAVGKVVSGSLSNSAVVRACPGPLDFMDTLADDDHDDVSSGNDDDDGDSDTHFEEDDNDDGDDTHGAAPPQNKPEDNNDNDDLFSNDSSIDSEDSVGLAARLSMGELAKVKSRQIWRRSLPRRSAAVVGDYVGVRLAPLNKRVGQRKKQKDVPLVRPGVVLGPGKAGISMTSCHTVKEFTATIVIFNLRGGVAPDPHNAGSQSGVSLGVGVGWSPILSCHQTHVPCKVTEFLHKRSRGKDDRRYADEEEAKAVAEATAAAMAAGNMSSGSRRRYRRTPAHKSVALLKMKQMHLGGPGKMRTERMKRVKCKNGDCVDVKLVPLRPLVVEPFDQCPALARFVLRDSRYVVAGGIVKSVAYGMHAANATTESSDESSDDESGESDVEPEKAGDGEGEEEEKEEGGNDS